MMQRIWSMALVVLMIMAILPTYAVAHTTFVVNQGGPYLWSYWNTHYRGEYPSWQGFRAKVSAANNLTNAEYAYRFLTPGTVLVLPSLPGETALDKRLSTLEDQQGKFRSDLTSVTERVSSLEREPRRVFTETPEAMVVEAWYRGWNWKWWLTVFGIVLAVAAILGISWYRNRGIEDGRFEDLADAQAEEAYAEVKQLRARLEEALDELHFQKAYLAKYFVPVVVPSDIGEIRGSNGGVIYLRRADKLDGDEAVYFHKDVVKLKNINHYFNTADDATLEELGVTPRAGRVKQTIKDRRRKEVVVAA